jgi:transposase InsO family protein
MESPNTIQTQDHDMTTEEKVARRKLSLLELAQELGNVSRACKVMGYSRQ